MCGWMHLPRYVDKIRLYLAGRLHGDYAANFGSGFDGRWLEAAGLQHEQFIEVVRNSITDGEICDWVLRNVKKTEADKRAHAEAMLRYPRPGDVAMEDRLKQRKEQAGISHRTEITTFIDFIDADEKRF